MHSTRHVASVYENEDESKLRSLASTLCKVSNQINQSWDMENLYCNCEYISV